MKLFCFIVVLAFLKETNQSSRSSIVSNAPHESHRIVGGSPTTIETFPYTAQILGYRYNQWGLVCAGTVLTTTHVMSAAHCFLDDYSNPSVINVRVGSTYSTSGGSVHRLSTIIPHPSFLLQTLANDIALLRLLDPITYSQAVQPAYIPAQGFEAPDNSVVTLVGWGATSQGGYGSVTLMQVQVYTINRTVCISRYNQLQQLTGYLYPVSTDMICAGVLDVGGRDACQGDSGGPMIYGSTVIGITSWGEGCANATYPGVSTRVSSFTNWITQTVNSTQTSSANQLLNNKLFFLLPIIYVFSQIKFC